MMFFDARVIISKQNISKSKINFNFDIFRRIFHFKRWGAILIEIYELEFLSRGVSHDNQKFFVLIIT